jgi:hypothetical protein
LQEEALLEMLNAEGFLIVVLVGDVSPNKTWEADSALLLCEWQVKNIVLRRIVL